MLPDPAYTQAKPAYAGGDQYFSPIFPEPLPATLDKTKESASELSGVFRTLQFTMSGALASSITALASGSARAADALRDLGLQIGNAFLTTGINTAVGAASNAIGFAAGLSSMRHGGVISARSGTVLGPGTHAVVAHGEEAFIPLRHGRVPVRIEGASGGETYNVVILANDAQSFGALLSNGLMEKRMLVGALATEVIRNNRVLAARMGL
jgi:hypothetical protein